MPSQHNLTPKRSTPSRPPISSPPSSQIVRPKVKSGDLCVGCIVWLPPRNLQHEAIKCCKIGCCDREELDDRGYNHPVIIMKIRQRKDSTKKGGLVCSVACVSLGISGEREL